MTLFKTPQLPKWRRLKRRSYQNDAVQNAAATKTTPFKTPQLSIGRKPEYCFYTEYRQYRKYNI